MRMKLTADDLSLIDQSAKEIVETAKKNGAEVVVDIPIIDIIDPTPEAVEALLNLELHHDVSIQIWT